MNLLIEFKLSFKVIKEFVNTLILLAEVLTILIIAL